MNETWGIPGPTFLWLFIGAVVIAIVVILLWRWRLTMGRPVDQTDGLPPAHVAFLASGPQRAVSTSLTWLRKAGAVDIDFLTRKLVRTGGVPAGASALDRAVLHAVGQQMHHSDIRFERSVISALADIRDHLERSGLMLTSRARRGVRAGAWLLLALMAIGVARVVAGIANSKPVVFLILVLVALLGPILWSLISNPTVTRAGKRTLADLRRRHQDLRKSYQTAWQTNSPAMTALAIGLFGPAILWAADPVLATATAAPISGFSSHSGGGGGAGTSCSSGGSDGGGGGGCGGGCGG